MIVDCMVSKTNTTSRPATSPSQVVWTASKFSLNSPKLITWAESSFCHRGRSLIVTFFTPPVNLCLHRRFNSEMLNISTSLGETLKSTKIPQFLFSPKCLNLFWRCKYQLHVSYSFELCFYFIYDLGDLHLFKHDFSGYSNVNLVSINFLFGFTKDVFFYKPKGWWLWWWWWW